MTDRERQLRDHFYYKGLSDGLLVAARLMDGSVPTTTPEHLVNLAKSFAEQAGIPCGSPR